MILVFDNIKNHGQIKDIVCMGNLIASNGSTLIITTWDWKAMEYYGIDMYKINIK